MKHEVVGYPFFLNIAAADRKLGQRWKDDKDAGSGTKSEKTFILFRNGGRLKDLIK